MVIAGHGRVAMPPFIASLTRRWAAAPARRDVLRVGLVVAFHVAALALMLLTEGAIEQKINYLLTWGLLNFFWLVVFRRPGISAALSLAKIDTWCRANK